LNLDHLQQNINEFRIILEDNISSSEPKPLWIIVSMLAIFMQANKELREAKSFKEQTEVFDLMKTVSVYIEEKKDDLGKLVEPAEKDESYQKAFVMLEQEKIMYKSALKAANKRL
jgi:hypothetical protein